MAEPVEPERDSVTEIRRVGFEDVGRWALNNGTIIPVGDDANRLQHLLDDYPQALYAFCVNNEVKYIGKTVRTLRQRFQGYRFPGARADGPNVRCNAEIRQALGDGCEVIILALPNRAPLKWGRFSINLAAGLEDALIEDIQPDWNA